MAQIFSNQLRLSQPLATKIFERSTTQDKLARAYMLLGHTIEDKWQLVLELTAYLNCSKIALGQKQSCLVSAGQTSTQNWCTNCRWIKGDQHPQALLKLSGKNNKSGKIAVEQARALTEEVGKTSPYFRVMVIEEANQDILHRPAANTLLKTIEEPRSKILIIFFSNVATDVLPTIISRCQTINLASKQYNICLSLTAKEAFNQFICTQLPKDELLDELQKANTSLEKFTHTKSNLLDAINLIDTIQSLTKKEISLDLVLDYLVSKELFDLDNTFNNKSTRYAKELFLINQIAKEQTKHYVSERAIIETFVYAWHQLKKTNTNRLKIQM